MARSQQNQAKQTFGETQNVYNQDSANANSLYNSLFPQFTAESTNPQGFTPGETASMNTAAAIGRRSNSRSSRTGKSARGAYPKFRRLEHGAG